MRTIYATPDKPIILGHEGDSFATQVIFDLSYFNNWVENLSLNEKENYFLVVEKNGKAYQKGITIDENKKLASWVVTNKDTAIAGDGRCQLFCQVGDKQNSIIFDTRVKNSIIKDFTFDDLNNYITIEDLLPEDGIPDQYMTLNDNGKLIWKDLPTVPIDPDEPSDKNVVAILNVTGSTETALTANFAFTQSKSKGVVIDFGDGSEPQVYSNTAVIISHTYPSAGEYYLSMIPASGVTWEPGAYGTSGNTTGDLPFCSKAWLTRFIFRSGVDFTRPKAFSGQAFLMTVDNFPNVTAIPSQAFYGCRTLENFTIPETVQTVGTEAFKNCMSLLITKFPSSLTTIESFAFYNCDCLTIGYFPERLTIGDNAFYGCDGLPSRIEIASKRIGGYAFGSCKSLTRAWIRNTVTTVTAYTQTSTSGKVSYYGLFSYCSDRLVIYAELSSRPNGWTEYFDLAKYYPNSDDRFRVIWNVSAMPDITLQIKWNENTRQLEHIETVTDGPDYAYNSTTESLEYM